MVNTMSTNGHQCNVSMYIYIVVNTNRPTSICDKYDAMNSMCHVSRWWFFPILILSLSLSLRIKMDFVVHFSMRLSTTMLQLNWCFIECKSPMFVKNHVNCCFFFSRMDSSKWMNLINSIETTVVFFFWLHLFTETCYSILSTYANSMSTSWWAWIVFLVFDKHWRRQNNFQSGKSLFN